MLETLAKELFAKVISGIFVLLCVWWLFLYAMQFSHIENNLLFGASYGSIALLGGIIGISISRKWGFMKSTMGKAIFFLSLGLLSQEFGQLVFSYYNILLHIPVPYPSIADIGFFGTIPLYVIALYYFAKSSGIQFQLKKLSSKLQVILIPIVMLAVSYYLFLMDYSVTEVSPLQLILDFGYPLGQSIFVSMAMLIYTLSTNFLGGLMRNKILFLIAAFIMQYVADFNFLYQNSRGTWVNGGYGDLLYLLAYFLMAFGIIQLLRVYKKIKHES